MRYFLFIRHMAARSQIDSSGTIEGQGSTLKPGASAPENCARPGPPGDSRRDIDRVFLMIQEDRELMQLYLDAVGEHGKQAVDSHLAKATRERFHTKLPDPRVAVPRSILINSYKEL